MCVHQSSARGFDSYRSARSQGRCACVLKCMAVSGKVSFNRFMSQFWKIHNETKKKERKEERKRNNTEKIESLVAQKFIFWSI
jgi:hypothetical protein